MEVGITLYKSNIISILEYASTVCGGLPVYLGKVLVKLNEPRSAASEFLVMTIALYKAFPIQEENF